MAEKGESSAGVDITSFRRGPVSREMAIEEVREISAKNIFPDRYASANISQLVAYVPLPGTGYCVLGTTHQLSLLVGTSWYLVGAALVTRT